jgi:RNA polymerase sigma-54 factor
MEGLGGGGGWDGEGPDFDSFAGDGVSLHDHLLAQAGERLSGPDLAIAGQIVEQIDETGYLLASTLDLASRLGAPLAEVERILAIVQTFDPPASPRAASPNASPSRRRRRTATIRRWRG